MTEQEFEQIDRILTWNLEHHVRHNGKTTAIHPLSGLIRCGECGGINRVSYCKVEEKRVYMYQCTNYINYKSCSQKQVIQYRVIEPIVIDVLMTRANQISDIASVTKQEPEPLKLRELRSQLDGLDALGFNSALDNAKTEIKRQIEVYKFQLSSQKNVNLSNHNLLSEVFSNPIYWSTLDNETKQNIFRTLIKSIIVKGRFVLGVKLHDGFSVEFPELQMPKELKGALLTVGSEVIVCSLTGERIKGVVSMILYRGNTLSTKRITVTTSEGSFYFDRRTGREVPSSGRVDRVLVNRWIEVDKLSIHCPVCNSDRLRKNGHHASGSQQFICKDCSKHFILTSEN